MPYEDNLQVAIQAARSGDRDRAREMLLALIRQNSKNFFTWLWLSELAKTREEQATALEQAQALCPPDAVGRRDLQPYLNRLREAMQPVAPAAAETPSTITVHSAAVLAAKAAEAAGAEAARAENARAETARAQPAGMQPVALPKPPAENVSASHPFDRAERLARIGKREEAVRLLSTLVKKEPGDERAWMLLSELEADLEEKQRLLQRVIAINPEHATAKKRLEALLQTRENPLYRGQSMEESGEYAQATRLYEMVIAHSRVPTDRIEASRRIENIRLRQESDQAQPIHPTLNLLRVTVGPVLLFSIMVFIQSGLNLGNASFLAVPGIASVLVGSFLVSAATMRPMHPRWIKWFGAPGEGSEPQLRITLKMIGWLCMLAPFAIFLVNAGIRLTTLFDSILEGLP